MPIETISKINLVDLAGRLVKSLYTISECYILRECITLIKFGWTKKNWLEWDLNLRPPDWHTGALQMLSSPTLAVSLWFHDFWLTTPEQRYWQNRETANVGLDSSVGRAPARQSGGRRFKSRSSQFFFVHPNLSKKRTQSVSLVVYCMILVLTDEILVLGDKQMSHPWIFFSQTLGKLYRVFHTLRLCIKSKIRSVGINDENTASMNFLWIKI